MIDLHPGDSMAPDGLPSLADGAVGCTIADPPYDARTHRAALEGPRRGGRRRVVGALPFAPLTGDLLARVAAELARVTRRWIVVFAADRQVEPWARALESAGAKFVRMGVALRTTPRPQLTGDRPAPPADWLIIAHAPGERLRWNGGGRAACWRSPAARHDAGGQLHPTQKPLALLRALLEDFTDAGELVCDPFAGAGTCAVACKELGRGFVGWELSPEYHARALRRLEDTREQLRLTGPTWAQERLLG